MSFLAYPVTDRQKELLALAGELADVFAKRAASNEWEGKFPAENYEDLRKSGYLTLTVPRDLGGWGASLLDVTLAQFRLGQGCASTALVTAMHLTHVARLVDSSLGQSALVERVCRAVVESGAMINSAASEPATGSPSRGGRPATTARRQSDGSWCLDGRKTFTTGSAILEFFLVSCSIEDEAVPEAGLEPLGVDRGYFLVPRSTPGLRIDKTWNTMGMRTSASDDLVLENVHLAADAYIGNWESYHQTAWSLPVCALYLGIGQAARDEAVQFAKRRRPNSLNQSIAVIPHVQDKVAKMDLALLQARTVLFDTAARFSADPSSVSDGQFAAAKYLATNHAVEVVELAMRLVGGASLSLNFPLQRHYRDVRAGLQHPPLDDASLALVAKEALEG